MWSAVYWQAWARGLGAPWHEAALEDAYSLIRRGQFEDAEARAQAVVTARHSKWGRDRRPETAWRGRYYALLAAVAHGQGESVLAELEVLIGELEQLCGWSRILLLEARITRAGVLIEGRPAEAQAEAEDVLRELMLIKHLTEVWQDELVALICLGEALCTQERYAEAEAIARGHLPRAEKLLAASMHRMLIRSLSGQGRHEEALAECRRALTELLPSASGDLELATAVALHGLGHHQEAEAEALRGLAACERHLHPTHPRVGEIKELLARITSD
ncbi:hypothetical protein Sxan_02480 [Streptomyces xanthophaeus]|uniref:Tetratricopeptide repeat protein n=1 Tax=Streptomyces xanthophaeus TaxID=67385 RepID=A0A919GWF9_9ACTN|nr:hypothetical protein Sxan_02480 [Streptomyces xanthophaeus]